MNKVYFNLEQTRKAVRELAEKLVGLHYDAVFGVPTGGIPVAILLAQEMKIPIVADIDFGGKLLVVDDIIDSGKTREVYKEFDFVAIHHKLNADAGCWDSSKMTRWYQTAHKDDWIVYWWEKDAIGSISDVITRTLQFIGEDVSRDGLKETPTRVIKSWDEIYVGYKKDPKDVFKAFDMQGYSEMVLLKDIEFYSMCEHHMLPFVGKAHIAYIPKDRVIGISKLARLLEIFARRLQIQERICREVTSAINDNLHPLGCACIIEAEHFCMRMRGVQKQNSVMVTSSLTGTFLEDSRCRQELMTLIKG